MAEPVLTIAIAQAQFLPGEVVPNLASIRRFAGKASQAKADLLVLPELATSGYFLAPEIEQLAQPIDGPTISAVEGAASEAGVAICLGYPERDDETGKIYNSAVLIGPDGDVVANHRKTHLWSKEADVFTAGDEPPTIAEYRGFKIAILVCYEIEFPELVRGAALAGADLIIAPTAASAPDGDYGPEFSRQIVGARATENNVFVAYVNHAGDVDGQPSLGSSVVAGPLCNLILIGDEGPAFMVATLDRAELVRARKSLPYLKDRRPSLY